MNENTRGRLNPKTADDTMTAPISTLQEPGLGRRRLSNLGGKHLELLELRCWRETVFQHVADHAKDQDQNNRSTPAGRSSRLGQSTVTRSRCEQCIKGRRRCDGVKPVCGTCQSPQTPKDCKYPTGNPSRSALIRSLSSDMMPDNVRTAGRRLESSNVFGAPLETVHVQVGSVLENQIMMQGVQTATTSTESQHLSTAPRLRDNLSAELQRLEEIRVRILDSTRAYLGADSKAK